MVSPKGKIYANKDSAITTGEGESFLMGRQLERLSLIN